MTDTTLESLTFSDEAHQIYPVVRFANGSLEATEDVIAEEVPVALEYNGISHTVMMVTPQDLEAFALGFSLSEGIIRNAADVYDITVVNACNGISVQLDIASACFNRLKEKRRSMTGRTGCGLCGSDSLDQALRLPALVQPLKSAVTITTTAVQQGLRALSSGQALQKITGATHACALVNVQGELLLCREDVGRHNALDKLIGAMQQDKRSAEKAAFIVTSSRASYEMVQKTIAAGVSMLVAVSAPTGLAIRVAEAYGVTLIGFARDARFVVYADQQQLLKEVSHS